jgi:hypothetical protein
MNNALFPDSQKGVAVWQKNEKQPQDPKVTKPKYFKYLCSIWSNNSPYSYNNHKYIQ